MNEFMVMVERAVRPVQAGPKRKLRMREELLAHMTSIYEEELARLSDDTAARAEAIRRFGDPTALTTDLQASVTLRDRIDARLDRAFGWHPGESAARYSARLAGLVALVLVGLLFLVGIGIAVNPEPDKPQAMSIGLLLRCWAFFVVLGSGAVFLMSLLCIRIRDSLHGAFGSPKSWRRVIRYATLLFLVLPTAGLLLRLLIVPEMSEMDKKLTSTKSILISLVGYLCVPLYVVAYARKAGPGEIRHVEWASLDIGQ
jgi:hypothetical protein